MKTLFTTFLFFIILNLSQSALSMAPLSDSKLEISEKSSFRFFFSNVVTKLLAFKGLRSEGEDDFSQNHLLVYSENGYTEIVRCLLERGINPDGQTSLGVTALMCAAEHGHTEIVQLLLLYGANPNRQNKEKNTALMFAASRGNNDIVQLFLQHEAIDVYLSNHRGHCASMIALLNGHVKTVQLLVEFESIVNKAETEFYG